MLDIGMVSYNNPQKLHRAINDLVRHTEGEYRLLIVDNNSTDPATRPVLEEAAAANGRIELMLLDENLGYAGGVNKILEWSEGHYVAYVENDAYIQTQGWNTQMEALFERHHELAWVFPNGGTMPINRGEYLEVLWGVGFCWMLNRPRYVEIGGFDAVIGHQNEIDYAMRLRLEGWKLGALPGIRVQHDAAATTNPDPANQKRINDGVIDFVNKWNKYFVGPNVTYHSPNVTRFEDWPINAIYMEEWYKMQPELQNLNLDAEVLYIPALGREVNLCKVPRWKDLYKDRII